MRRILQNVVLYFAIMPTAYVAWLATVDSHFDASWQGVISYFAFTAPVLPWVVLVLPVLTVTAKWATHNRRMQVAVAGLFVTGLPAVLLTTDARFSAILALGGCLYGYSFRLPAIAR